MFSPRKNKQSEVKSLEDLSLHCPVPFCFPKLDKRGRKASSDFDRRIYGVENHCVGWQMRSFVNCSLYKDG